MAPNTTFGWESKGSLGTVHHWFAIAENGSTTTLTKGAEVTDPSTLGKMMSWKLARDIPRGFRSDLATIKATLEKPSS
jgi:hypothetical protein